MYVSIDVEADGPCPGLYSMISFGAVVVEPSLDRTFYGECAPLIHARWNPDALAVSKITRGQHLGFRDPAETIYEFKVWLNSLNDSSLVFVTDNPAFDWQFINYYFCLFGLKNPFGFSARRIGDIWSGWCGDMRKSSEWKKFRKTKHTHNPVDDAKGNAEALLYIINQLKPR